MTGKTQSPAIKTPGTPFWNAVEHVFQKIDAILPGNLAEPLVCVLAGGAAVHLYTQARASDDVDAVFTRRLLLPSEIVVGYKDENGDEKWLELDRNYTCALGLMHPDYLDDALPVKRIGAHLQVKALSPVDLAVSKIARFQGHDRQDILDLAGCGFFTAAELEARAMEALDYHICPGQFVLHNLADVLREVSRLQKDGNGRR